MANKCVERCLHPSHQGNASPDHNETLLHTIRMAVTKNYGSWQVFVRLWRNRNPCALLMEMKNGAATMAKIRSSRIEAEMLCDPAV